MWTNVLLHFTTTFTTIWYKADIGGRERRQEFAKFEQFQNRTKQKHNTPPWALCWENNYVSVGAQYNLIDKY